LIVELVLDNSIAIFSGLCKDKFVVAISADSGLNRFPGPISPPGITADAGGMAAALIATAQRKAIDRHPRNIYLKFSLFSIY
jgi:hypothetical protein